MVDELVWCMVQPHPSRTGCGKMKKISPGFLKNVNFGRLLNAVYKK